MGSAADMVLVREGFDGGFHTVELVFGRVVEHYWVRLLL